jgi:hypothetical protein
MNCVFEKPAFINVFEYVRFYLLRFVRVKRLKVFQIMKLLYVLGLLFKQCTIFWRKNEQHNWREQSLFFHLHITCYYKYATGLQLLAIN